MNFEKYYTHPSKLQITEEMNERMKYIFVQCNSLIDTFPNHDLSFVTSNVLSDFSNRLKTFDHIPQDEFQTITYEVFDKIKKLEVKEVKCLKIHQKMYDFAGVYDNKIGGIPYIEDNSNIDGLVLLFQFNFAKIKRNVGIPSKGIFQVFYKINNDELLFDTRWYPEPIVSLSHDRYCKINFKYPEKLGKVYYDEEYPSFGYKLFFEEVLETTLPVLIEDLDYTELEYFKDGTLQKVIKDFLRYDCMPWYNYSKLLGIDTPAHRKSRAHIHTDRLLLQICPFTSTDPCKLLLGKDNNLQIYIKEKNLMCGYLNKVELSTREGDDNLI